MKTIAIYGDSISTGTHGEGGYEAMLKSSLSLEKVYNFAVGSSGLTRKTPGGMLEVLDKNPVPEDAELFLIWHGLHLRLQIGSLRCSILTHLFSCEQAARRGSHRGTGLGDSDLPV